VLTYTALVRCPAPDRSIERKRRGSVVKDTDHEGAAWMSTRNSYIVKDVSKIGERA
jgi:hypothetical protein